MLAALPEQEMCQRRNVSMPLTTSLVKGVKSDTDVSDVTF